MLDKKLTKFIILFYLFTCCYSIFNVLIRTITTNSFVAFEALKFILASMLNYGTKFIFIFFALVFTRKYIIDKIPIGPSIVIHTLISMGLTFYSSFLNLSYEKFVGGYDITINWTTLFNRFSNGSNFNFFVYFTLITVLYAYYYFKKQKNQEIQHSKLKAQLLDSKITALQSQLQPHFLFNVLNDISSLIEIDKEKSQDAISDLSDLLRQTLNLKDTKLHQLKEEIDLLAKYIDIEKIRFDEKINFKIDVKDELLKYYVPPLMLQPIVENSIKHGFSYNHDVLNICIDIQKDGQWLSFNIENNGKLLESNRINYGNGLSNVIDRIDTLYPDNYHFKMSNNSKSHVLTTIKIPLSKSIKPV